MRAILAIAACALVASCHGGAGSFRRDAAEVDATVAGRTGVAVAPACLARDDGAIAGEARAILGEPLTEEAAVRVALLNNREIQAFYAEVGIARAELIHAGLLRNPVFSGQAEIFDDGTKLELGLTQSFLEVFYIPLRRCIAASGLEAAKASVARRVIGLTFDVRRAFADARTAQRVVAMHETALDVVRGSHELRTRLHAAGNATDEQMAAEVSAVARARLELADAESLAIESREPLNALMGIWGQATRWTFAAPPAEPPAAPPVPDRCENRAIEASLDLAELRALADAAARRAGLASWEGMFPMAEIGVAAEREPAGDWGIGPAAGIEIPVFDQGQAEKAAAAADLRRHLARYTSTAVLVRAAARTFRERVSALEERAVFMEKVHMPAHDRLLREVLKRYNAMQTGAFDVLVARRHQVDAGREHLETLRDLDVARADLAELLAGNLNRARLGDRRRAGHASDQAAPMEGRH